MEQELIFEMLHTDHDKVRDLLTHIEEHGEEGRAETLLLLRSELLQHNAAEEEVFYDYLERKSGLGETVGDSQDEHSEVNNALDALEDIDIEEGGWEIAFADLRTLIEDHIEKEESILFDRAKEVLSQSECVQLGRDFLKAKERMGEELGAA